MVAARFDCWPLISEVPSGIKKESAHEEISIKILQDARRTLSGCQPVADRGVADRRDILGRCVFVSSGLELHAMQHVKNCRETLTDFVARTYSLCDRRLDQILCIHGEIL
jgi:hypothetical protein